MKIRFYFLLLACCLLSFTSIEAQNNRAERAKDRAENRANRKVDNKVDRTVDNAVDDAFNAIGGLFKKKDKQKKDQGSGAEEPAPEVEADSGNAGLANLFGGKWEPYTNPKAFSLTWQMTTTKRNGKEEKMNMEFSIQETQSGFASQNPEKPKENVRMILDTETGMTTMISQENGEWQGTRMRLPNMQAMMQKEMEKQMDENRWTIERTGERMTIDGYDCEKYIITDTETGDVTTSWVTDDAGISWVDMSVGAMGAFGGGQVKNPMSGVGGDLENGILIKSTTVTKKETIELYITNIKTGDDTDTSILDVSGIEITELRY